MEEAGCIPMSRGVSRRARKHRREQAILGIGAQRANNDGGSVEPWSGTPLAPQLAPHLGPLWRARYIQPRRHWSESQDGDSDETPSGQSCSNESRAEGASGRAHASRGISPPSGASTGGWSNPNARATRITAGRVSRVCGQEQLRAAIILTIRAVMRTEMRLPRNGPTTETTQRHL